MIEAGIYDVWVEGPVGATVLFVGNGKASDVVVQKTFLQVIPYEPSARVVIKSPPCIRLNRKVRKLILEQWGVIEDGKAVPCANGEGRE